MRLSDAIRLGAMLKPQIRDRVFDGTGTCAFGAAFDAVGAPLEESTNPDSVWEWLEVTRNETCPACGMSDWINAVIARHLNDEHGWTREQIADWVATIEPAESSADHSGSAPSTTEPAGSPSTEYVGVTLRD